MKATEIKNTKPDIKNWVTNARFSVKATEIEKFIPSAAGFQINATEIKNKMPDASTLFKKINFLTKLRSIRGIVTPNKNKLSEGWEQIRHSHIFLYKFIKQNSQIQQKDLVL